MKGIVRRGLRFIVLIRVQPFADVITKAKRVGRSGFKKVSGTYLFENELIKVEIPP